MRQGARPCPEGQRALALTEKIAGIVRVQHIVFEVSAGFIGENVHYTAEKTESSHPQSGLEMYIYSSWAV